MELIHVNLSLTGIYRRFNTDAIMWACCDSDQEVGKKVSF